MDRKPTRPLLVYSVASVIPGLMAVLSFFDGRLHLIRINPVLVPGRPFAMLL